MALVTLFGVAVVVFVLLRVVPGDPIAMMISPGASPADIAALRALYGLDAPHACAVLRSGSAACVSGDFGTSISLHRDVLEVLGDAAAGDARAGARSRSLFAVVLGGCVAIARRRWRGARRRSRSSMRSPGCCSPFPDFLWALVLVLALRRAVADPADCRPHRSELDRRLRDAISI